MFAFVVILAILFIFLPWFSLSGTLSSGDWPYLFVENIKEFAFFSEDWILWLTPYYQTTSKIFVQYLNLPWELVERIFWFWPLLILSIFSSYYLTRSIIGILVYTTNTYILMLVGGGQMGVAMGYALAPLVLGRFINPQSSIFNLQYILITGLILAVQMMFDPRIAYVSLIAIVLYYALFARAKLILRILVSVGIALVLNSWWIIKIMQGVTSQVGANFESVEGLVYFSFSDFSHAFSLLHPNWPENIFGKTYFMKPEFIILPILAYSSLLFMNSKFKIQNSKLQFKSQKLVLFFALLGIIGAFLVKGVNEPFGFINLWMFEHIPGFTMFRDPTKFYLLVVLSYSALIPFSVYSIYDWLKSKVQVKSQNFLPNLFLIFTILYLIFFIRPAVLGQGGTFKPHAIPQEYISLKNFILGQKEPFNTLWVPKVQRYGFYSKSNEALSADQLFGVSSISAILRQLREPRTEDLIKNLNIKYVIVPYDSQKEIFLKDRKYDPSLYYATVSFLQKLEWIERKSGFGDIIVFKVLE